MPQQVADDIHAFGVIWCGSPTLYLITHQRASHQDAVLYYACRGRRPRRPEKCGIVAHGTVADKYIKQMNDFYENITVESIRYYAEP